MRVVDRRGEREGAAAAWRQFGAAGDSPFPLPPCHIAFWGREQGGEERGGSY